MKSSLNNIKDWFVSVCQCKFNDRRGICVFLHVFNYRRGFPVALLVECWHRRWTWDCLDPLLTRDVALLLVPWPSTFDSQALTGCWRFSIRSIPKYSHPWLTVFVEFLSLVLICMLLQVTHRSTEARAAGNQSAEAPVQSSAGMYESGFSIF